MKEFLFEPLQAVATAAVPVCAAFLVQFLRRKSAEVAARTDSLTTKELLAEVTEAVTTAVTYTKELGATTKFTATEAAEGFTYMAMAGWRTKDMLNGIDGIMSLAAADGLDLATTSDIVTDAMTAFKMSAITAAPTVKAITPASGKRNTVSDEEAERTRAQRYRLYWRF